MSNDNSLNAPCFWDSLSLWTALELLVMRCKKPIFFFGAAAAAACTEAMSVSPIMRGPGRMGDKQLLLLGGENSMFFVCFTLIKQLRIGNQKNKSEQSLPSSSMPGCTVVTPWVLLPAPLPLSCALRSAFPALIAVLAAVLEENTAEAARVGGEKERLDLAWGLIIMTLKVKKRIEWIVSIVPCDPARAITATHAQQPRQT